MNVYQHLKRFFLHPESRAVGLLFLASSWGFGSWVIHIPYIKDQLGINDATLGLLLFGIPFGQIITNMWSPFFIRKWGLLFVAMLGAWCFNVLMIVPVFANHWSTFLMALLAIGFCYALLNIAMNTIAGMISAQLGYSVMSTCHAMWSIGGMLGTLFAFGILRAGGSPQVHMVVTGLLVYPLLYYIQIELGKIPSLRIPPKRSEQKFSFNHTLVLLILIGILLMVAEGFAFDWSAVFLRDYRGATGAYAALGFSLFMLAMTIGRLNGDYVLQRFSARFLLVFGGLLGGLGLLLAVFVDWYWAGCMGLFLLGLGCALNSPILYGMAMKLPDLEAEVGLATFATFSFVGFLAGPPIIGWVAEVFSLEVAMLGIAVGMGMAVLLVKFLLKPA